MNPGWRVLVIGGGWISRQVHLPYLAGLLRAGTVSSLAVTDIDPARAELAARDFGLEAHHGPVRGADANLVVVATPPRSHAARPLEALAAAAHVIVEKPLVLTAADASAITAASARHDRGVYPLYTTRHRPEVALIRQHIASWLEPVRRMTASWLRRSGVPATSGGLEAGVLWDLGSHLVDTALYLSGWEVLAEGGATARHRDPAPGARAGDRTASWQAGAAAAGPAAPRWHGVSARAGFAAAERSLTVRASWATDVAHDVCRVELESETRRLVWRTVFGWSPDRSTVPAPAVWTSGTGHRGENRDVLLESQFRHPHLEYTGQLDAALAALSRFAADPHICLSQLHAARASTIVLQAMQKSLDTGSSYQAFFP